MSTESVFTQESRLLESPHNLSITNNQQTINRKKTKNMKNKLYVHAIQLQLGTLVCESVRIRVRRRLVGIHIYITYVRTTNKSIK